MFFHRYRGRMTKEESEFIRLLRTKGFAVMVFDAGAMKRGEVEEAMRKAGDNALHRKQETRS